MTTSRAGQLKASFGSALLNSAVPVAVAMSKAAMPPGIGPGKPVHPFAVTVEEPVANAIVPDGYGIKYHAYHTM
ncbi:hypothetical protein EHS25_008357 [Saitozyma podzolica]|uniref:Uncharacterized protein n=1 Tax=Saitozyma podzolica TaxID=1890683 RepID=A0A427YPA5_9TREE|nr:hypothetical protein EHS25_008357 [Saitozyma podzolica]